MPESVEKIVGLFNTLFELIRDVLSSTNKLSSEVGKHRASVNEAIQIFRDRPCFAHQADNSIAQVKDQAIKKISETGKASEKVHIKSLSDANERLVKLIVLIFTILVVVNTSIFGGILFFVHKNPQIWEIVKVLISNGGK